MDAAHPLSVTFGQVVVDRDDVDAVAGDRVEIRREHAGEGLAFTGLHLGDVADVQRRAAHDLDVVVLLTQHSPRCLPRGRESFEQHLVERFTILMALTEFIGLGLQLGIGKPLELRTERADLVGEELQTLDGATLTNPQQTRKRQRWHGTSTSSSIDGR